VPLTALILAACPAARQTGAPRPPDGPANGPFPAPEDKAAIDRSQLNGRIAFAHEGDVWIMNADGTRRRQLTDHAAEDFDPVWSPDGRWIAFRSHRDGNEEVYMMRADGSGERNLTRNPTSDYSPAWSPDGARMAFATDRDPDSGGNDIYLVEPDGQADPVRVTTGGGIDEYPTWSPDGTRLAFSCTGGRILPDGVGDFEICVVDLATGEVEQLTDAPGISDHPAWSPDGRRIAFMSTREGWPTLPEYTPAGYEEGRFGDYDVYVMDADGTNVANVTSNGREDEQYPAWSPDGRHLIFTRYGCLVVSTPDGSAERQVTPLELCADGFPDWHGRAAESDPRDRWLAFVDERGGTVDLFAIRADGTGLRRLTRDRAAEQYPSWSPDGSQIVFERRTGDSSDLWLIDVSSGAARRLTENPGIDWTPAWSPDGNRIAFASVRQGAPLSLYTMTPEGRRIRRIRHTEGGADPAWSPDGTRLAYRKELPGNDEIFVIDPNGSDGRNLTEHPANDFSPDWSPHGNRVVFESVRDANYELYSVSVDGSNLRRLTTSPASDQFPAWGPNGRGIVYSHRGELHLIDAATGTSRPLRRPVTGNFPAWGPCRLP
jgi:Tol biopolymer transport system component